MSQRLSEAVLGLSAVMSRLRAGCPWDREQTHASLRRYLLEECYEVLDALEDGRAAELRGELGDLLFQVWFHAEIASEPGGLGFDLADVLEGVTEKLVRRHPHVFGGSQEGDAASVQRNWERRKLDEGRRSRLDGVPPTLPSLLLARALQGKAAAVGFDWADRRGPLGKAREELEELLVELERLDDGSGPEEGARRRAEDELGDLLFSLVNVARAFDLDAEAGLRRTCRRFAARFRRIEDAAAAARRELEDLTLEEMDALWDEAKRAERGEA